MKGLKKLLSMGLVVAMLFVLAPVVMPAAPVFAQTTDVSGNITEKIVFTAPAAISSWALAQGTAASNEQVQSGSNGLNVKCNTSWATTVVDADSNTAGYMTSYNGTGYVSANTTLDNALLITSATPSGGGAESQVTLSMSAQQICNGVVGGQGDDDVGENVNITFNQQIEYQDPSLSTPNYYRIVITFSATIS